MKHYDTIIIGAGHNGLVCATYLAKKGQKVLLLEASKTTGGLAANREFYQGFKTSVAQTISHFSTKISKELNLSKHGYQPDAVPMSTMGLNPNGEHVTLSDLGTQAKLSGVSAEDSTSFEEYRLLLQRFVDLLKPFWLKSMPRIGSNNISDAVTYGKLGLKLRLLGKNDMGEFLR